MILSWVIMVAYGQYGNLAKKKHTFLYIYRDKKDTFYGDKQ